MARKRTQCNHPRIVKTKQGRRKIWCGKGPRKRKNKSSKKKNYGMGLFKVKDPKSKKSSLLEIYPTGRTFSYPDIEVRKVITGKSGDEVTSQRFKLPAPKAFERSSYWENAPFKKESERVIEEHLKRRYPSVSRVKFIGPQEKKTLMIRGMPEPQIKEFEFDLSSKKQKKNYGSLFYLDEPSSKIARKTEKLLSREGAITGALLAKNIAEETRSSPQDPELTSKRQREVAKLIRLGDKEGIKRYYDKLNEET